MKTQIRTTLPFSIKLLAVFLLGLASFALTASVSASNVVFSLPPLQNINVEYVNGIQASRTVTARKLLPLNAAGKFLLSVIPQGSGSGLNADTLDGLNSSYFAFDGHDHFGDTWTDTGALGLKVVNLRSDSSTTQGVWADNASTGENSVGLFGVASASTGNVVGVWGATNSPQGAGVRAWGAGPGTTALQIAGGGIKVDGAGPDGGGHSDTPVFVHQTTVSNVNGGYTVIDNSLTNSAPNAILIVTTNINPGANLYDWDTHSIGVYYDGVSWTIYNVDGAAMPLNVSFNVLVIKP